MVLTVEHWSKLLLAVVECRTVSQPPSPRHLTCLERRHFVRRQTGAPRRGNSTPCMYIRSESGNLVSVSAHATGHAANTPATTTTIASPINRRQPAFQCARSRSSSRLQPKKRPLSGQLGTFPVPADFKRMRPPLATSCKDAGGLCVNANDVEQGSDHSIQQTDGESVSSRRLIPPSISASGGPDAVPNRCLNCRT